MEDKDKAIKEFLSGKFPKKEKPDKPFTMETISSKIEDSRGAVKDGLFERKRTLYHVNHSDPEIQKEAIRLLLESRGIDLENPDQNKPTGPKEWIQAELDHMEQLARCVAEKYNLPYVDRHEVKEGQTHVLDARDYVEVNNKAKEIVATFDNWISNNQTKARTSNHDLEKLYFRPLQNFADPLSDLEASAKLQQQAQTIDKFIEDGDMCNALHTMYGICMSWHSIKMALLEKLIVIGRDVSHADESIDKNKALDKWNELKKQNPDWKVTRLDSEVGKIFNVDRSTVSRWRNTKT